VCILSEAESIHFLVLDRDAKYSDGFRNVLVQEGIHIVRLPPRSDNARSVGPAEVRERGKGMGRILRNLGDPAYRRRPTTPDQLEIANDSKLD
jgi:hypothetical protein